MKLTAIFFLYLLGCLGLGALLTQPLLETGWIDYPPHRVMSRLAQAFMLLGFWPLLRFLRCNHRQALGYGVPARILFRSMAWGWVLGVLMLAALVFALFLLEIRVPDERAFQPFPLLRKSLQAIIGGLLVALLEETLFRGALQSAIREKSPLLPALIWSAGLYALVHFMKPHPLPEGMVADWAGIWHLFSRVFLDAFRWQHLDSFIALLLAGLLLGLIRARTGHLGWSIGLHAGWVFVLQLTRFLTDGNPDSPLSYWVGSYDGIIGWLGSLWIGSLLLLYAWRTKRTKAATKPASSARSATATR